MSTATYDSDVYEDGQQFKDDAKLMVKFHMEAIRDNFRSEQEGRAIFIEVPYITIITPGSKDNLVTEATEHYQNRFRRQWENFKARIEDPLSGTPLSEVPWMTVGQVAELNAMNVKTVEQLVDMPDNLAQRIMGAHQLRQRAQRFLDAAKGEAVHTQLEQKLQERDDKIREQGEQIKAMQAQLEKLLAGEAAKKVPAETKK